jgi:hypothetical protein
LSDAEIGSRSGSTLLMFRPRPAVSWSEIFPPTRWIDSASAVRPGSAASVSTRHRPGLMTS